MFNTKLLVTFGLVVSLLLSIAIVGSANYWDDVSNLFFEAGAGIDELGGDATAMSQGTMSMSTGLEYAKDYQRQAFNQLVEIVELTPQAPNIELHARLVNVMSAWYTTTGLWKKGLAEYDTELITGATRVMEYVARKSRELTPKIH